MAHIDLLRAHQGFLGGEVLAHIGHQTVEGLLHQGFGIGLAGGQRAGQAVDEVKQAAMLCVDQARTGVVLVAPDESLHPLTSRTVSRPSADDRNILPVPRSVLSG